MNRVCYRFILYRCCTLQSFHAFRALLRSVHCLSLVLNPVQSLYRLVSFPPQRLSRKHHGTSTNVLRHPLHAEGVQARKSRGRAIHIQHLAEDELAFVPSRTRTCPYRPRHLHPSPRRRRSHMSCAKAHVGQFSRPPYAQPNASLHD